MTQEHKKSTFKSVFYFLELVFFPQLFFCVAVALAMRIPVNNPFLYVPQIILLPLCLELYALKQAGRTANEILKTVARILYVVAFAVSFGSTFYLTYGTIPIRDAQDFARIEWNPRGNFLITENIDFDDDPEDSAGCVIELFSGVLDGGNHAISGLNKALICRLDSEHNRTTIVKDLTLTDVSILNPDLYWNGAVVADNGGTIQNVHVTGTVSGSLFVGGLVGSNYGTIEQSSFTGTIQASLGSIAGGLVAVNHGTIRESFSAGSITGVMVVGGLVGTIDGGTISNCYTHMNVVGANHVGGIAGTILDRIDSVIQSVAVYGDITGDAVGVISSTSYVSDVPILFAGHVDSAAYVAEAYVMYTEGQTFVVPPENTIDIAALDDAYYLFVLEFNPSVWIINMGEARFLPTLRDNPE